MNPNKALWEKGDFTRIAETMRESGEALALTSAKCQKRTLARLAEGRRFEPASCRRQIRIPFKPSALSSSRSPQPLSALKPG
jgi:hypothetical protein